jgi:hypothetical protein
MKKIALLKPATTKSLRQIKPHVINEMAKARKIRTFNFDELEELVGEYYEESEGAHDANITFAGGFVTLTIFSYSDNGIEVYRFKEDISIYAKMDDLYTKILEVNSSGSDFHDKWYAMLEALPENSKIIDIIFEK